MENKTDKRNLIREKTYKFSLHIIALYKQLKDQNEYVLSKQILRSGTSIGANVEEATAAQSRKDFISKMSIASKEARETNYWLRLIRDSNLLKDIEFDDLIGKCEELIKILTSIVKTSQKTIEYSTLKHN
jgi:four helix bundle protein